jgi:hypothetical protein
MKVLRSTASAMSIGKYKPRVIHTGPAIATKEADVIVKDIKVGTKSEKKEKKRGIKGLFGWKN